MTDPPAYLTISSRRCRDVCEDTSSVSSVCSSLPNTLSSSPPSSHQNTNQSPVGRLSRLLRNSFSKLRPRSSYLHTKSKSADVLKKHLDDYDDEEKENVEVVSPIEQEMVIASMRAGMPIIPFPMPSLVIANNNLEETKTIIRENSLKDIKFHQQTGSEGAQCEGSNSETEYVVHSPFITSDEKTQPGDYMVMFSSRRPSQQILLTRHETEEEPIFHLEQMSISAEDQTDAGRDGLAELSGLERRRYKKGHKHRGDYDYCLLDLGTGKKRSSSFSSGMEPSRRPWKTLTYNKK